MSFNSTGQIRRKLHATDRPHKTRVWLFRECCYSLSSYGQYFNADDFILILAGHLNAEVVVQQDRACMTTRLDEAAPLVMECRKRQLEYKQKYDRLRRKQKQKGKRFPVDPFRTEEFRSVFPGITEKPGDTLARFTVDWKRMYFSSSQMRYNMDMLFNKYPNDSWDWNYHEFCYSLCVSMRFIKYDDWIQLIASRIGVDGPGKGKIQDILSDSREDAWSLLIEFSNLLISRLKQFDQQKSALPVNAETQEDRIQATFEEFFGKLNSKDAT